MWRYQSYDEGQTDSGKTSSGRNQAFNLLTLSAHAREGYSSHFVCHSVTLSVCHFSILEKVPF